MSEAVNHAYYMSNRSDPIRSPPQPFVLFVRLTWLLLLILLLIVLLYVLMVVLHVSAILCLVIIRVWLIGISDLTVIVVRHGEEGGVRGKEEVEGRMKER